MPPGWHLTGAQFKITETAPAGWVQPTGHWILTPTFVYELQRVEFDIERVGPPGNTPEFQYVRFVGVYPTPVMAELGDSEDPAGSMSSIPEVILPAPEIIAPAPMGAPIAPFSIVFVSDWDALRAAVMAPGGAAGRTIVVQADINSSTGTAPLFDTAITLPAGFNITIVSDDSLPGAPFTITQLRSSGRTPTNHRIPGETHQRHFIVPGGAQLTLENIILSGDPNSDEFTDFHGGVQVSGAGSRLTMNAGSVIAHNVRDTGAGVELISDAGNNFLVMREGSVIRDNHAALWGLWNPSPPAPHAPRYEPQGGTGGGVRTQGTITTMYPGSLIANNTAQNFAGGVDISGSSCVFTMYGGAISGNRAVQTDWTILGAPWGDLSSTAGGIRVSVGTVHIRYESMIGGTTREEGNEARTAGAIHIQSNATVHLHNGSIMHNFADSPGGVNIDHGYFIMDDGLIAYNRATHPSDAIGGGGVRVRTYRNPLLATRGEFIMNGGTITRNFSASWGGGVLVAGTFSNTVYFTMHGGTISQNYADRGGGGVSLRAGQWAPFDNPTFVMYDGTITENRASGASDIWSAAIGHGGGVHVNHNAVQAYNFTMHGGTISYNHAHRDGGGIFSTRHLYVGVLPPTYYDNLRIHPGTNFYGNTARAWFRPPNIPLGTPVNRLPHLAWDGTESSVHHAGAYLYLLNNFDINFRAGQGTFFLGNRELLGVPFRFHKSNELIYSDQEWDTPGWLAGTLLQGAEFNLFRFVGAGTPPELVTQADLDAGNIWELVNATPETSSGLLNAPIEFLVTLGTTYQLVEIVAPGGFQLPWGQWRIVPSLNALNVLEFSITAMGDSTIPAFVYILTPCGNCTSPDCALVGAPDPDGCAAFIHFVGNRPVLILPLMGGMGRNVFILAGALVIFFATTALAYHAKRKGFIPRF